LECGFLKQLTFIEKMLKTFFRFLVFIPFLLTIPSNAQPGIKAGMSISALQSSTQDFRPFLGYEISWLQYGTSNPEFGLQLGIFYTVKLSNPFNLQPELYFSEKGYQFDQTPLYNTNYSLSINYLELPVLLEYYLPLDRSFNTVIMAGPFAALNLGNEHLMRKNEKIFIKC
jgi:hypothetical protein